MTQALVIQLFEDSIDQLTKDLSMLKYQMQQNKEGMFITYDIDLPAIVVYASPRYKAYIPRRYQGWDVKFVEWDGEDIQIDLDISIAAG